MERAELAAKLGGVRRVRDNAPYQLLSESDPQKFMAAFAEVVAGDSDVFLCDPQWGAAEKAQVAALLQSKIENSKSKIGQGWLCIPTGGSGGQLKFARHDQHTIAAAVRGFTEHFGLSRVNALGVLPLHHVSGFMAWMRCALTGGEYVQLDWKTAESGNLPELPVKPDGWVISLVPTQLERLLRNKVATEWLATCRIVFLGGAPASTDLLERAAAARIPLAPGYGMTETAAMVTALRPEEFLAGARSSGRALPHGQIKLTKDGTILVTGQSVFRGYYPDTNHRSDFVTGDLGCLDEQGHLTVLGRSDDVIITGGEKVNPAEIEAVLRDQGGLAEVVVVGVPDAEWGQVVVAAYPASSRPDLTKLAELIAQLAPAKRPKHFLPLESWPLTSAGKVNRAEVVRLAGAVLLSGRKA